MQVEAERVDTVVDSLHRDGRGRGLDRNIPERTWQTSCCLLCWFRSAVYGSCAPAELKALCYPD
jgi:hypothetical protein